jgi:DNA-directed RNA polymerase specialized sigma subunit
VFEDSDLNEDFFEKLADIPDWNDTQKFDFELWKKWKDGGERPSDFRPLLQQFKPMVRKSANRLAMQADLPSNTVHAECYRQFLHACKTFNPEKGAGLGTWVTNNLRKAQRWAATYQDPLFTPETRYYKVGVYNNAKATLDDQLGREPTTLELAEHMAWPEAEVARIQAETRGARYSGGSEKGMDPTVNMPTRDAEVVRLIKYQLGPEEMQVYEHTGGFGGKEKLSPGEISKKLNMSPSKVSRIRNSIVEKMEKYMK